MKFIKIVLIISFLSCKEKAPDYSDVKHDLKIILESDQKYRVKNDLYKQKEIDAKNSKYVTNLIDSLGWLGKEEIGDSASEAIFLVIQHSDKQIMEKYFPILKEAVKNGRASKQHLAYMTDRIEILNNRLQIYGTQVLTEADYDIYKMRIKNIDSINFLRKKMGLSNIEEYYKKVKNSLDSINK